MAQYGVPVSDEGTSGGSAWSYSTGSTYYGVCDEGSDGSGPNNTDYYYNTSHGDGDYIDFKLTSSLSTPGSGTVTMKATWRLASSGKTHSIKWDLYQGDPGVSGSLIATVSNTNLPTSWTNNTHDLSAPELANITDWTDLWVRQTCVSWSGAGGKTDAQIDYIQLQTPDASGDLTETAATATMSFAGVACSATHTKYETAATGTVAFAGVAVDADHTKYETADTASMSFAGVACDATHTKYETADTGSVAFAGVAVGAILDSGDLQETADTATMSFAGVAVDATHTKYETADTAAMSFAGVAVDADHTKYETADTASMSFAGIAVDATHTKYETAGTATISWDGVAVGAELDTGDLTETADTAVMAFAGVAVEASGGAPPAAETGSYYTRGYGGEGLDMLPPARWEPADAVFDFLGFD